MSLKNITRILLQIISRCDVRRHDSRGSQYLDEVGRVSLGNVITVEGFSGHRHLKHGNRRISLPDRPLAGDHGSDCQHEICDGMCNNGITDAASTQHKKAKAGPCNGACKNISMHVPER